MSEIRDRAMAIAALVEAFGVEKFSPVRTRTYDEGLKEIPIPLLNAAVRRAIETRKFFPKVSELREDAESCRQEILKRVVYEPCELCNYTGWVEVKTENVTRSTRCACRRAYLEKLAGLGAGQEPLALPPARDYAGVEE